MYPMQSVRHAVADASQVAEAKRRITELAKAVGLDETEAGKVTLIATEMGTNLAKHGGGGWLIGRRLTQAATGGAALEGVEILAVDGGRGMADPAQCLRDGFSTAGTPGNGLGAIRRLGHAFDLFSRTNQGTVVLARVWRGLRGAPPPAVRIGVVALPMDGEEISGDGWQVAGVPPNLRVTMVDGLGHGPLAAAATEAALATLAGSTGTPGQRLQRIHEAIRHTRGAAGAICEIDGAGGTLRYCGVGNIAGSLMSATKPRSLVSHNGTLGLSAPRFQDFSLPWTPQSLLVLHSDGLTTRWDLSAYPGLAQRDPALIAAVLWRDFQRGRDDATVLVVKAA
jgi:anti-sigma regulatory factor (Ser/Thr protein kinase)